MTSAILHRVLLVLLGMTAAWAMDAAAQPIAGSAAAEVPKIMDKYAAALSAGEADTLVNFYTSNGVFMRDDLPAVTGIPALRASYRDIFATLKTDLKFTIQELEEAADMAWLRATSVGKVKVLATGVERELSFNVLVVFRKEGATWKIRSYLYAANRPDGGMPK